MAVTDPMAGVTEAAPADPMAGVAQQPIAPPTPNKTPSESDLSRLFGLNKSKDTGSFASGVGLGAIDTATSLVEMPIEGVAELIGLPFGKSEQFGAATQNFLNKPLVTVGTEGTKTKLAQEAFDTAASKWLNPGTYADIGVDYGVKKLEKPGAPTAQEAQIENIVRTGAESAAQFGALFIGARRAGKPDDVIAAAKEAAPQVKGVVDAMNREDTPAEEPPRRPKDPMTDVEKPESAERRVDLTRRDAIRELMIKDPDAAIRAIETDPLTGMRNGRALANATIPPQSFIAYLDVDSLGWTNDFLGHAVGDELIKTVGTTLKDKFGDDAYRPHEGGDEFVVKGSSPQELNTKLHEVADTLQQKQSPHGTSPQITWGIGGSGDSRATLTHVAEANMRVEKTRRILTGKRAEKGKPPVDWKGAGFYKARAQAQASMEPVDFSDLEENLGAPEPTSAPPLKENFGAPEGEQGKEYSDEFFAKHAKRIRQERKSAWRQSYETTKRYINGLFPSKTGEGEIAAALLSKVIVKNHQELTQFWTGSVARRKLIARLNPADRLKFIHELQNPGDSTLLPGIKPQIRAITEALFKAETAVSVAVQHIDEYFSQYFQNSDKVRVDLASKRADQLDSGIASFQLHRHWKDMGEALDHGGVPLSDNAEDLLRMRMMASIKMRGQKQAMQVIQDNNLLRRSDEELGVGEGEVTGPDGLRYVGPENVISMLKHGFFSTSLWTERSLFGLAFRSGMGVKMAIMPVELGFNLFHPQNLMMFVKPAHNLAETLYTLEQGPLTPERLGRFAKGMVRSLTTVSAIRFHPLKATWDALHGNFGNADSRPIKAIRDAYTGKTKPEDVAPTTARYIQQELDAAYRPIPTSDYVQHTLEKVKDSWSDKNMGPLVGHTLVLAMQAISIPLMEHLIPYLKTQDFHTAVERAIADDPSLENPGLKRTLTFSRIRRNTDLRFGQTPYDLEFWSKGATASMQVGFLSFTWFRNWVDQFPGGAVDAMRLITKGMSKEKAARYRSSRLEYAMIYTAVGAYAAYVTQKLLTGKDPTQVKDLVYPIFHIDADGTEHRLSLPSYNRWPMDAYYNYEAEGVAGIGKMLAYKADPVFGVLHEQWTNKNFYNQEISNPTADWLTRFGQRAKSQFMDVRPIPFQSLSAQENWLQNEPSKVRTEAELFAFAGDNPAPKYITNPPIVSKIYALYDHYNQSITGYEKVGETQARRHLLGLYKGGKIGEFNTQLMADAQKYQWSEKSVAAMMKGLYEPQGAYEFSQLPPAEQLRLLKDEMTPEMARQYLPEANVKVRMAYLTGPG